MWKSNKNNWHRNSWLEEKITQNEENYKDNNKMQEENLILLKSTYYKFKLSFNYLTLFISLKILVKCLIYSFHLFNELREIRLLKGCWISRRNLWHLLNSVFTQINSNCLYFTSKSTHLQNFVVPNQFPQVLLLCTLRLRNVS